MNLEKIANVCEYSSNYEKMVAEAAQGLSKFCNGEVPHFGIVLGSGLGYLADLMEEPKTISFEEIPNFPKTSMKGHEGKIVSGKIEGINVVVLKGRLHYYEVANEPFNSGILKTVFPVHVLADMGVKNYFVTNSARALNSKYEVGDIMMLKSHISYFFPKPLLGADYNFKRVDGEDNTIDPELKLAIHAEHKVYDSCLRMLLNKAGGFKSKYIKEGIYVAIPGPNYETEGEANALSHGLNADAIGMSTINEVIVALDRGMKVVGFSYISNKVARNGKKSLSTEDSNIIAESNEVRERTSSTFKNFFRLYNKYIM